MSVRTAALAMGLQGCAAGHFGMPTEALPLAPGDGVEGSFSATMGVATGLTASEGMTPVIDAMGFLRAPVSPHDSFILSLGGGNPQIPWIAWTLGASSTLFYGAGTTTALAGGGTRDLSDALGWTVEGSLEVGYGAYGTGGIADASWLFATGPSWRLRSAGRTQPFVMLRAGAAFGHTWFTINESKALEGPAVMGLAPALQLVVGARPK